MTTIVTGEVIPTSQINQWCPPGLISDFGGDTAPDGWLLCDGASYLRADHPELFTAIGTKYGTADGTHFNVPDFRGRVPVGFAASGGHADVSTLGNNEGSAASARRPKHPTSHALTLPNHQHAFGVSTAGAAFGAGVTAETTAGQNAVVEVDNPDTHPAIDGTIGVAGSASDTPAYLVVNKIIRSHDV